MNKLRKLTFDLDLVLCLADAIAVFVKSNALKIKIYGS